MRSHKLLKFDRLGAKAAASCTGLFLSIEQMPMPSRRLKRGHAAALVGYYDLHEHAGSTQEPSALFWLRHHSP